MANQGLTNAYENFLSNELTRYRRKNPIQDACTFGRAVYKDAEGAKEVVNSWHFSRSSKDAEKKKDFRTINKQSVKSGAFTARDFRSFSKTGASFLPQRQGTRAIALVLPEEKFSYGFANRPSTPLGDVLAHQYGARSAALTQEVYKLRLIESQQRSRLVPKMTKTAYLSQENAMKKIQTLDLAHTKENLFKIKKFELAKPRIDTINKAYLTMRSERDAQKSARSISLDIPRPRKVQVAQSQNL